MRFCRERGPLRVRRVIGTGVLSAADFIHVLSDSLLDDLPQIAVRFDKAGTRCRSQPQQVRRDENLPVAFRTGPDPDGRNLGLPGDLAS